MSLIKAEPNLLRFNRRSFLSLSTSFGAMTSMGGAFAAIDPAARGMAKLGLPLGVKTPWAYSNSCGYAYNLDVSNGMMFLSVNAGTTSYTAAQLWVFGKNATSIKGSISPSATLVGGGTGGALNGLQPKDGSGTNIAPTALTWGSTDPNDENNPGGGASTGAITNQSGSISYPDVAGARIGYTWSDWTACQSLARTDMVGGPALCYARWLATYDVPSGNRTPGYRDMGASWDNTNVDLALPNLVAQVYGGADQVNTTSLSATSIPYANGGAPVPINSRYWSCAMLRFRTVTAPKYNFINAGDSTSLSYKDGYGGIDGPVRMMRNDLEAAGIPAAIFDLSLTTGLSENFHYRAKFAIQNRQGTHIFLMSSSVNDTQNATTLEAAHDRVRNLVALALMNMVLPVIVISRCSAGLVAEQNAFCAEMRACGVPCVSQIELLTNPATNALYPQYDQGDGTHFSLLGRQVMEGGCFATLSMFLTKTAKQWDKLYHWANRQLRDGDRAWV